MVQYSWHMCIKIVISVEKSFSITIEYLHSERTLSQLKRVLRMMVEYSWVLRMMVEYSSYIQNEHYLSEKEFSE